MRLFSGRFRQSGLLVKMFLVTVVSIIAVTVIITWTTIRMSERFFIETFSITNFKVLTQIKESFESYHQSVVIASNNVAQSGTIKRILSEEYTDPVKLLRAYYNLSQQMKRVSSSLEAYEAGVYVMGTNGLGYSTDRTYWPINDEELRNHPITRDTRLKPTRLFYQYDYSRQAKAVGAEPTIVASKALMERMTGKSYGTMYFAIPESEWKSFYANYTSPGNDILVMDRSGVIVSSNRTDLIGDKATELLGYAAEMERTSADYRTAKVMGKELIVLSEYLAPFDMYLVNLIDKQTAIGHFIDRKAIVLIVAAVVMAALLIVFLISRRLTRSLSMLVRQIGSASKFDFSHYVKVGGSYETRQIGHAFNAMLDELHDYVEKLVQSQKQIRNAELEALQQQINPHFLYNTLASIKFLVQQGSKEEAAATINALISLLQNAIGHVSETITIGQELVNLRNYVFINQKRYGDRIKVSYFAAPDCLQYHIPRLILQPFIENSFFHAFNRKPEGSIHVMVWREGELLICEVVDNGDGMEVTVDSALPNVKNKRQLFTGIGVRNVNERIKLIYGEAYGVSISSERGEGTKVRIVLPLVAE